MKTGLLKSFLITLLGILFLTQQPALAVSKSSSFSLGDQKVVYNMPYAGILPDHPFYFLKRLRDFITDVTTRDAIKKASLYLLYSDKHMVMAQQLADKGKEQLAVKTLITGEEFFIKIIPLLEDSKKQGTAAPDDLVQKIKNSNVKHREIIDALLKTLNQGEREGITKAMELNEKAKTQLEKMK